MFISLNRLNNISTENNTRSNNNNINNSNNINDIDSDDIDTQALHFSKLPLIFVRGVGNISAARYELMNMIGSDKIFLKVSYKSLKVQTLALDYYRINIHF